MPDDWGYGLVDKTGDFGIVLIAFNTGIVPLIKTMIDDGEQRIIRGESLDEKGFS